MTSSTRKRDFQSRRGRRPFRREPKPILIVTEGEKTEKEYFDALIQKLGVGASVDLTEKGDSAPTSVVRKAMKSIERGDDYEIIYCVFDRDNHDDYDNAIKLINSFDRDGVAIHAIPSIPCFECWLYLHSDYLTKPYSNANSSATQMLKDLRRKSPFENYNKSISTDLFEYLFENRHNAKKHAIRAIKYGKQNGHDEYHEDPSSRVYLVLDGLENFS